MNPHRNLAAAVALVLAVEMGADAALAALPYQGVRSRDYPNSVLVWDHPAVYLHGPVGGLQDNIRNAEIAKRDCNRERYGVVIGLIRGQRLLEDLGYRLTLKDAREAEVSIPLEEKTYQDLAAEVRATPKPSPELLERFKAQGQTVEKLRQQVREAPALAEFHLQDANTLASIILWLEKIPFSCPAEPTKTPAPPPAPTPAPAVGQGAPRTCSRAQAVLDEVNAARTDPAGYAGHWRGGDREALDFLRHQAPVPALQASPQLQGAAGRQAADLSAGTTPLGHVGSDGSKPMRRINEAGLYSTLTAELISVGQVSAAGAVQQLITDAGQPNRPHRADLFNPNFTLGGVGCGERPGSGLLIVITLSNAPIAR